MMKRTSRSPCHSSSEIYNCYNSVECSRSAAPPIRPMFPVRGYWIPESPPPSVHYRAVYAEPSPVRGHNWYPPPDPQYSYGPPPVLLAPPPPPPPPPFYGPCVYNQTFSFQSHYLRTHRDIIIAKLPIEATHSSHFSDNGDNATQPLNLYESTGKPKASSNFRNTESSEKVKHKKYKSFQKIKSDKTQDQVKEGSDKYTYDKSNNELDPEILATWRKNLNRPKSKESTHKLKIEICLTTEETRKIKIRPTLEENTVKKKFNLEKIDHLYGEDENKKSYLNNKPKHHKKMSSSESFNDKNVSEKIESIPLPDSPSKDKKPSSVDTKSSALRFTPSQINKVQKKKNDGRHSRPLKRSNYTPIIEALKGSRSKEDKKSPLKDKSKTSDRDRSLESRRHGSQEPERSMGSNSDHDSDNEQAETYRSREEHSPSSVRRSVSEKGSPKKSSPSKSHRTSHKSDDDSDSEMDRTQSSSIYVTPVGTPFSRRYSESEGRRSSGSKRSLSDELDSERHSANSSINSSSFYTPESSPSKFNSAKRMKIRWSDTSMINHNKPSYLKHNSSFTSEQGIQPELIGYQMVGDSQFCRFGQQLLGLDRVPMPNSPGRIGICVSGQTITDLHRRVKDNFYPISDKIILMIGTNDFLRNVDVGTMCEELSALVKTLQKSASNIILLTLPPIPKLEKKSTTHFKQLDVYNSHIRSLENGETLRIADISPLYMTSAPFQRCRMHLFEVYFGGQSRRLDLIHLNRLGLEVIRKYILDKFL